MTTKFRSLLVPGILIALLGCTSHAATIYVDESSPDGNGLSWGNSFRRLEDALFVAKSGDQIWVAEGLYVPGESLDDTFLLEGV